MSTKMKHRASSAGYPDGAVSCQMILSISRRIHRDVERLAALVAKLDLPGIDAPSDVFPGPMQYGAPGSLLGYMEGLSAKFRSNGKVRTAETYVAAVGSFRRFLCEAKSSGRLSVGDDLRLNRLTSDIMEAYQAWHKAKGNCLNTISFYTRILRAAYNRAVEEGLTPDRCPFRRVYTGVDKTVKRAIPLEAVSRLARLDLPAGSRLDFARDMFLMSFYLRGISFIDLACLRKADLRGGVLTYRRRKTGQLLTIRWTPEMQRLLDKYPRNPTDYLMPLITNPAANPRNAIRNVGYNINHHLKAVGRMARIPLPLTMYVARHSWASAAKAKGVPLSVISQGMGHDSEATTRIYLASLETSVVDRANSLILSFL